MVRNLKIEKEKTHISKGNKKCRSYSSQRSSEPANVTHKRNFIRRKGSIQQKICRSFFSLFVDRK